MNWFGRVDQSDSQYHTTDIRKYHDLTMISKIQKFGKWGQKIQSKLNKK